MPSGNPADDLLTTREAAARLGISPGRVRQLVLAGELPATKRGRDLLIPADAVAAYVPRPVGRPSAPKSTTR